MTGMIEWPKVMQLRHALKELPLGDNKMVGTVKLHGTNGSYKFDGDRLRVYSRTRELSLSGDNNGFFKFMQERKKALKEKSTEGVTYYGEYIGKGINKGCAIHSLSKRFVLFGKYENGEHTHNSVYFSLPDMDIYNVLDFPVYHVVINKVKDDFMPTLLKLVDDIETMCPVGKHFGVTEGNTTGEGLVFSAPNLHHSCWFKIKGQKHRVTSSKPKLTLDPALAESFEVFVASTMSENRMLQGYNIIKGEHDVTIKDIGRFLQWCVNDVLTEEADHIEVLKENYMKGKEQNEVNKIMKNLRGMLHQKARNWFFKQLDGE